MSPRKGPTQQHRTRDDRGSVAIQMALLLPALFAVMFLGMQASLYYHARSVALAAAEEGAREAAGQTGTRDSGIAVASAFLRDAGGDDVMTDTGITGTRTAATATVTVTGKTLSVIPGWRGTVTQHASMPVERITP
ncbi:Flp pilus assembly protein TadG [Nocardioides sp. BE266]|uniref:TadE family protein n=1 Tax=Nocardioides sp. BE266 TaxID=2817725 RepID=UPI00285FA95E|nr:pilus assembly protein [Nocardioides sp. BE266]MDR7254163.1 Flp pilus assembly protein TadG [Nocardioides sp. BE266]